jgi:hypothetical protein
MRHGGGSWESCVVVLVVMGVVWQMVPLCFFVSTSMTKWSVRCHRYISTHEIADTWALSPVNNRSNVIVFILVCKVYYYKVISIYSHLASLMQPKSGPQPVVVGLWAVY